MSRERFNARHIARKLEELSPALSIFSILVVGTVIFLPFTPSVHIALRADGTDALMTKCEYQPAPIIDAYSLRNKGILQLIGYVLPHSTIIRTLHIAIRYNGDLIGKYAYNVTDGFYRFDVTFMPFAQNGNVPWIITYWIDSGVPMATRFYPQ